MLTHVGCAAGLSVVNDCRSARQQMEAGDEDAAAELMTAALSFYEAASQLNDSDIKLMVSLALSPIMSNAFLQSPTCTA